MEVPKRLTDLLCDMLVNTNTLLCYAAEVAKLDVEYKKSKSKSCKERSSLEAEEQKLSIMRTEIRLEGQGLDLRKKEIEIKKRCDKLDRIAKELELKEPDVKGLAQVIERIRGY